MKYEVKRMDKYSILDPTLANLCRTHECHAMRLMQSEIERLESLSMAELESELKRANSFERMRLISRIMTFKMQNK